MTLWIMQTPLLEQVELLRLEATRILDPERRVELGQFLTPAPIAQLMSAMLPAPPTHVRLLDAGAGVGSLLAAGVEALAQAVQPPERIEITAYEIDPLLQPYLNEALQACKQFCAERGIELVSTIRPLDFVADVVERLRSPLFADAAPAYTCALLNPPYRKIRSGSMHRRLLSAVGIETSNLYTAFLALAIQLLDEQGTLVAITPRSFCNGPYFRPFRRLLLDAMALHELHVFESREDAFEDDGVLQENLILAAAKGVPQPATVNVTISSGPNDELPTVRAVPYAEVVQPGDPEQFIRLVADTTGQHVARRMDALTTTLVELGLAVSTGRVVDFRATTYLLAVPGEGSVPLIYPTHLAAGGISWPKPGSKKPNAIAQTAATKTLLVPNERFVLVKRFSSKEEPRRVTAAVYEPDLARYEAVGFENHLNYFHAGGHGLERDLAYGLSAFLNSTIVDAYVRQFSGHTQVNATDLRTLRYPSANRLRAIGSRIGGLLPAQAAIDAIIAEELTMTDLSDGILEKQRRVAEALAVLRELRFPKPQLNERSALTLLALLDLTPERAWTAASNPLRGITPMMEFFAQHYGRKYKPNTRETVRRQTVHQFLDAGLILANPDEPTRPVNSPRAVYQIEPAALNLLCSYDTPEWSRRLYAYLTEVGSLKQRYAQERAMERLPVQLPSGDLLSLSPGGQNTLVKLVIEEFAARFTPEGEVI